MFLSGSQRSRLPLHKPRNARSKESREEAFLPSRKSCSTTGSDSLTLIPGTPISVKKCAVTHIHSGNTRPVTGPSFDIGGYALPIVDHVKDLSVLIDDRLKFHLHSAFTRANLILKCFNSRNVQVLLRALCCQSLKKLLAFGLLTSLLISVKLKVFSANLLSAFLAVAT